MVVKVGAGAGTNSGAGGEIESAAALIAEQERVAATGRSRRAAMIGKVKMSTRAGAWTETQVQLFFDELALTCNIAAAAAAANVAERQLFRRRRSDPAFLAMWEDALSDAAERMRLAAMQRAMEDAKTRRAADGISALRADVAGWTKLAAAGGIPRERHAEVSHPPIMPIGQVERILTRRLAAVERRLAKAAAEGAAGPEAGAAGPAGEMSGSPSR